MERGCRDLRGGESVWETEGAGEVLTALKAQGAVKSLEPGVETSGTRTPCGVEEEGSQIPKGFDCSA